MRWLDGITHDSMNMHLSKLWKVVKDRRAWCAAFHAVIYIYKTTFQKLQEKAAAAF